MKKQPDYKAAPSLLAMLEESPTFREMRDAAKRDNFMHWIQVAHRKTGDGAECIIVPINGETV